MAFLLLTSPSPAPSVAEDGSPGKLVLMVVIGLIGGLLVAGLSRRKP